jgi:hypothetical protein
MVCIISGEEHSFRGNWRTRFARNGLFSLGQFICMPFDLQPVCRGAKAVLRGTQSVEEYPAGYLQRSYGAICAPSVDIHRSSTSQTNHSVSVSASYFPATNRTTRYPSLGIYLFN